jgi:deoxyhypusine synthase
VLALDLIHVKKGAEMATSVPDVAAAAVLQASEEMPEGSVPVSGYDFSKGFDLNALLESYTSTGFQARAGRLRWPSTQPLDHPGPASCSQATNFGLAVEEIRRMLAWRLSDEPPAPCPEGVVEGSEEDSEIRDTAQRAKVKATIFLGCTSNLISAGTRETVRCVARRGVPASARWEGEARSPRRMSHAEGKPIL